LEPVVQTTGETLDDASVTAQVVTALMTHRSTSSVITRVTTRNGEVTLTGIAMNDSQNAMIVKIVTDIRGVTSVKNQMTIENEPRTN
jgi:osmotically-inducible protein OsmY